MQRFVPLLIASANLLATCPTEAWSPKCDTPLRTYAWAGGFDSLLWVNDRTGGQTNSHFVAYDGNANVRALVDASTGLSSAEYEYGPFGDVIRATGPMALKNPIRFSSKYQDPESGLLYYGYRYYSAQHQKWLSRDPISYDGGLNLYGFVDNDPVNGADELGLWNYWNPATYGVANGVGWSVWDSFNPFHESASWNGYSGDYFRQSVASATGWGVFGGYDECDEWLKKTRWLGRGSKLTLEILGPLRLARWGMAGHGLLRGSAAFGGYGIELYQSGAAVHSGYQNVQAGNNWGYLELGVGLLGVRAGVGDISAVAGRYASRLTSTRKAVTGGYEIGARLPDGRIAGAGPGAALRNGPDFSAAKSVNPTYVQMEFPFARGAAVQTPGVTTAGETFVRVGAGPRNLKFGSTSLSGAQPGTYAFPEATFNAIGQNPAALKNFGDLPGAAPQYFRVLQPPPGTPIQRGIVPGGEFGGVGGVPEVIFPKGF